MYMHIHTNICKCPFVCNYLLNTIIIALNNLTGSKTDKTVFIFGNSIIIAKKSFTFS